MLEMVTHKLSSNLEYIRLFPINDLHVGDKTLDKTMFRKFIKDIAENPNDYAVLIGDLLNNATKDSVSNVYNDEMSPRNQLLWVREELLPIKNKILGIVEGNHEHRSKKSTDTHLTADLADYLNLSHLYREEELVIKITFGQGRGNQPIMYTTYMTHGSGGGKMTGSKVNNTERLVTSVENADIYIVGHGHDKWASKKYPRRIDAIHGKIQQVEKLFVMSSHWAEFFGGYGARYMFTPTVPGSVPIKLYGDRKYFEATI